MSENLTQNLTQSLAGLFRDRDHRPRKQGWAPGTYIRKCFVCRKEFLGDKRSVTCAPCAHTPVDSCPKCGWIQETKPEPGASRSCENCGHEYEVKA